MKHFTSSLILFLLLLLNSILFAQFPNAFNYQAVFRNSEGILVQNEEVRIIFKIIAIEGYRMI